MKKPFQKSQPSRANITAYQGAATATKTSHPRGSKMLRTQVRRSRRQAKNNSEVAPGTSTATGPLVRKPRAIHR